MGVEKGLLSAVAGLRTEEVVVAEASDSNSSILTPQSNKRPRHGSNAAAISAQKFKGVLQQQNGHWGAQIYTNHQRIWLGTFKSDEEAAMAYNSAAIKLRSGDPHRNIPRSQKSLQEHEFRSGHTTESVLAMIKDGTYHAKLWEYLSTRSSQQPQPDNDLARPSVVVMRNPDGFSYLLMFKKEMTPSDVGKLNRLVIPKKYAIQFFPRILVRPEEKLAVAGARADDVQLVFYDRFMRAWNFRYCYWSGSHSFVFTRGWNMFVKEKELNAGDIVGFYGCVYRDQGKEGRTFCMVDVIKRETGSALQDEDIADKQHGRFRLFGVDIK